MQTKYDIGGTALVKVNIERIDIRSDGAVQYHARIPAINLKKDWFDEATFEEADYIDTDTYEKEIDDLKDEIERLREMYQLEHMKVLKQKFDAADYSHSPQQNSYSDEWRKLP